MNIRPWLVVMFILSCITTISFNLYFKRVPCTSKKSQTNTNSRLCRSIESCKWRIKYTAWGQAGTSTKFLTSKRRVLVDSELLKETAVNKQCRSALYAMAIYPSVCLSVCLSFCPSHADNVSKRLNTSSNFDRYYAIPIWGTCTMLSIALWYFQ